jgi:hypothetical protein
LLRGDQLAPEQVLHRGDEPVVFHPSSEIDECPERRGDRDAFEARAIRFVDPGAAVDDDRQLRGERGAGTQSSTRGLRAPGIDQRTPAVPCDTTAPSPAQSAAASACC